MTIRDAVRQPKKRAFVLAYCKTGNISDACKAADIGRATHYRWLDEDAEYKTACKEAEDTAAESLEREARRRAYEGVEEPVYQGKELVGTVRKYSDTLLIFLLKGVRPDKYRENVRQEVTGKDGKAIEHIWRIIEDAPPQQAIEAPKEEG